MQKDGACKQKQVNQMCVCVCEIISMHSCVGVRAGNGQDVQNSKFPSWPVPWQETPAVLWFVHATYCGGEGPVGERRETP